MLVPRRTAGRRARTASRILRRQEILSSSVSANRNRDFFSLHTLKLWGTVAISGGTSSICGWTREKGRKGVADSPAHASKVQVGSE